MKRIGLFGGTFNPIHFGHLRTVREVQEGFGLDKIYLIPSALPPHKSLKGIAHAKDRLEMTRLAVSGCTDFMVSDVELRRSGPSYTIDTVRHFKQVLPKGTELYLILGRDAFLEINLWKCYKELFRLIPFVVMARPGTSSARRCTRGKVLENDLKSDECRKSRGHGPDLSIRVGHERGLCSSQICYAHPENQPVHMFNVTMMDISATKIRELIREGKSIQFLVPEKVEDFIKTKGLFL